MWFNDTPSLKTPQRLPVSELFALADEECLSQYITGGGTNLKMSPAVIGFLLILLPCNETSCKT